MSTYAWMNFVMTIPPENYAAVIERFDRYRERDVDNKLELDVGQTALDVIDALLATYYDDGRDLVIDEVGIHIDHGFGTAELGYSEASDMEELVAYALPGGVTTVKYEENDTEYKWVKLADGSVERYEPLLVYPDLPDTIDDREAALLEAALKNRKKETS